MILFLVCLCHILLKDLSNNKKFLFILNQANFIIQKSERESGGTFCDFLNSLLINISILVLLEPPQLKPYFDIILPSFKHKLQRYNFFKENKYYTTKINNLVNFKSLFL